MPGATVGSELKAQLQAVATTFFKAKGSVLFRSGDHVTGAFLIKTGEVELGMDGNECAFLTRTLGAGTVLGLPATLSGNPYSLTAAVKKAMRHRICGWPEERYLAEFWPSRGKLFQLLTHMEREGKEL